MAARRDRVRQQVLRWQNQIYDAVIGLESRLSNILDRGGYTALSATTVKGMNPNWSISYEYFMPTTLFLFAQYFCWVQLFREGMSYELFSNQEQRKGLIQAMERVSNSLSKFPFDSQFAAKGDRQVFRLQQRALGEALIVKDKDSAETCMRLNEFLREYAKGSVQFAEPLHQFLDGLEKQTCQWERLEQCRGSLGHLNEEFKRVLGGATLDSA